ncbi:kinesin-like protein KIN-10A, partial [Tanacetum coccineum]
KIISNGEEGKECHFHIWNQSREDMKEIQKVEKCRIVKSTFCNERSSKSHCMIILDVPTVGGRLMLVDMAGSENIEQAGQTGFEAKMQIAVYTISTWSRTVMKNMKQLIGRSASPDFLTKLTYLIWIHHEDMLLNKAHKIGEVLQEKLEQLAEVERVFVHIDFEFSHVKDLNTKPRIRWMQTESESYGRIRCMEHGRIRQKNHNVTRANAQPDSLDGNSRTVMIANFEHVKAVITQINQAIGAAGVMSQQCKTLVDHYGKTIIEMLLTEEGEGGLNASASFVAKANPLNRAPHKRKSELHHALCNMLSNILAPLADGRKGNWPPPGV